MKGNEHIAYIIVIPFTLAVIVFHENIKCPCHAYTVNNSLSTDLSIFVNILRNRYNWIVVINKFCANREKK